MAADEEWFDDDAGPVVHPYAVTGGRTQPADASLELVALVFTTAHGSWLAPRLDPEKQAIAALCREIQSIAEISARLGLPGLRHVWGMPVVSWEAVELGCVGRGGVVVLTFGDKAVAGAAQGVDDG